MTDIEREVATMRRGALTWKRALAMLGIGLLLVIALVLFWVFVLGGLQGTIKG